MNRIRFNSTVGRAYDKRAKDSSMEIENVIDTTGAIVKSTAKTSEAWEAWKRAHLGESRTFEEFKVLPK